MPLPAVELDDLAGLGPDAVDLVAVPIDFEQVIEERERKAVAAEEGDEDFLEGAAGPTERAF
jgi:hypothetical protein